VNQTGCSVPGDTLHYRLEESVSRRHTRHTQLFTYLLTHKLVSSCIWRYLVSHACNGVMPALSAYFQFSLLFFHVRSQAATAAYMAYQILDIGRCQKCGKYVPCMRRTVQRKDFELIPTLKMETVHPVKGSFGSEFQVICNHCGVMVAWSRKTLKFCEKETIM